MCLLTMSHFAIYRIIFLGVLSCIFLSNVNICFTVFLFGWFIPQLSHQRAPAQGGVITSPKVWLQRAHRKVATIPRTYTNSYQLIPYLNIIMRDRLYQWQTSKNLGLFPAWLIKHWQIDDWINTALIAEEFPLAKCPVFVR